MAQEGSIRFEDAEGKWPRITQDAGGIHIGGRYRPAALAQRFGGYVMGTLLLLSLASCVATGGFQNNNAIGMTGVAALLVAVPAAIIAAAIGAAIRAKLDVSFTPQAVRIKPPLGKERYYRLGDVRGFALEEWKVARKHRVQAEARNRPRPGSTFRNTTEAVMWYGRKRITVATFHFKEFEKAESLVRTLQDVQGAIAGAVARAAAQQPEPQSGPAADHLR